MTDLTQSPHALNENPQTRWRDFLDLGQADQALLNYSLGEERNDRVLYSLKTLAGMQDALREKSWSKALKLIQDLEDPGPITNWQRLLEQLELVKEAGIALDKRDPETTLELLADIDNNLVKAEAETLLGTAQIFLGQNEAAKAAFNTAIEHDPKHYRAITNLANLALEEGNIDQAISSYEKALKINDGFSNALHNLGVAYRKKGQIGKSVQQLRKAQRAGERRQREEARETLKAGSSPQLKKFFRWAAYGVAAILVYIFLRSQGYI